MVSFDAPLHRFIEAAKRSPYLRSDFSRYILGYMKPLQLSGLLVCAAFFVSCAETETASNNNGTGRHAQSKRRMTEQPHEQPDEVQQNLWNAQRNVMNRDGSVPFRGY
jgi:hypothetical protein